MDQLYSFRDCYFDTHSVEDAGRKPQDVREEMEKTLQQMKEVMGMSSKRACSPLPITDMCRVFSCCVLLGILFVAATA